MLNILFFFFACVGVVSSILFLAFLIMAYRSGDDWVQFDDEDWYK